MIAFAYHSLYDLLSLHALPSQNGLYELSLHPHKFIYFTGCSIENFNGSNDVPSCEPSQNGCFKLSPQLHHLYFFE